MGEDDTIGHFDVVRLKNPMDIIKNNKRFRVKKGSIGITQFEPYAGVGVYFEGLPEKILVPMDEKNMKYIFKNIRSTVRIEHIRDDADV